jgi:hypothetical protein
MVLRARYDHVEVSTALKYTHWHVVLPVKPYLGSKARIKRNNAIKTQTRPEHHRMHKLAKSLHPARQEVIKGQMQEESQAQCGQRRAQIRPKYTNFRILLN